MENLSPLFAEWDKILGDPVSYDTQSDPGTVPPHPYSPLLDDDDLVKRDCIDSPCGSSLL